MKKVIVDAHNEVLPYWFKERLKLEHPMAVVRIDEHHDMHHECSTLPAREGRTNIDYLSKIIPLVSDYAIREINEANFTCSAFHYGIIGALYHFNPKNDEINAYGRISGSKFVNTPITKEKYTQFRGKRKKWIIWDEILTRLRSQHGKTTPMPQRLTIQEFGKEFEGNSFSTMICFDLDGLYGIKDNGPTEKVVSERLRKSKRVLECVPFPIFAGIARSQTPRTYVPSEIVDDLQDEAMNLIEITYD
jgi:hypothetical protein